ncbi:3-methyl-2-oxobutanoate hydroxymethyltransferase [Nonomuraea solani]|uniref:3-methyl-2-oxobutanoate hydroxymethyltransferase n=1 Tax=Nonomuraea solani TaxID=1144553 RepID=A0A1H6EFM3_9ACTN|nr:3-methyl-2-oxobutanoate hydroxymethyltransferase [Nonomuraea solani]SEG96572.1 3-methyl-2-oxobutanoate hydroxymethyltransferase [Nonomuraea solani]
MTEDSLFGGSKKVRVQHLRQAKERGEKWPMLTSYDQYSAEIFDEAGVPVLLIGDSAANNVLGYDSTLPIGVEELLPLTRGVAAHARRALVIADLPFGSFEASPEHAFHTAVRFMKAGAQAVKLEGGRAVVSQVKALARAGIPVMSHIGFTPQHLHGLGGYRVQGRGQDAGYLLDDALRLEEAGAFAIGLELVPAETAREITENLSIPTVGIGAGPYTDAQVMIWQDLAGLRSGPPPRYVKQYADMRTTLKGAVELFAKEVREGIFPGPDNTFQQ